MELPPSALKSLLNGAPARENVRGPAVDELSDVIAFAGPRPVWLYDTLPAS
jgi:hypothetical protein